MQIDRSDYDAAMQLRTDFVAVMQSALSPSTVMLMPILAGASPRVPRLGAPMPTAAQPMLDLTAKFTALVAMSSCPAAVLPVPALEADGAPWAVLLLGRHRCDLQLMQLAVRLSGHIDKTAATLRAVRSPHPSPFERACRSSFETLNTGPGTTAGDHCHARLQK